MPLTAKGEEIRSAMEKEYGEEKGKQVFYASKNAGKISGVDEMNEGVEGLKTYGGDSHHHEVHGMTGPEIEDKKAKDAEMGLVHVKEDNTKDAEFPKPVKDAKFTHEFPNDPFGDKNPQGGFDWNECMSREQMKSGPFHIYHED